MSEVRERESGQALHVDSWYKTVKTTICWCRYRYRYRYSYTFSTNMIKIRVSTQQYIGWWQAKTPSRLLPNDIPKITFPYPQNNPQLQHIQGLYKNLRRCAVYLKGTQICSSTHGILLCPAASRGFILWPICLVHVGNLRHQGIVGVWISQKGTNGKQYLWNSSENINNWIIPWRKNRIDHRS